MPACPFRAIAELLAVLSDDRCRWGRNHCRSRFDTVPRLRRPQIVVPQTSVAARQLVDRNNELAGGPLRVPVEPQFTLESVLDDPVDHSCAEALTLRRPDGWAACLRPSDDKTRFFTRPLNSNPARWN